MTNIEKAPVLDQGQQTRTLSPTALRRVILGLTYVDLEGANAPIPRERANEFKRAMPLVGELVHRQGAYYLDFKHLETQEGKSDLVQAVEATDDALVHTMLPATVTQAWAIDASGPPISAIKPENWDEYMTDVTASAVEVFSRHREALNETSFQKLLYDN